MLRWSNTLQVTRCTGYGVRVVVSLLCGFTFNIYEINA